MSHNTIHYSALIDEPAQHSSVDQGRIGTPKVIMGEGNVIREFSCIHSPMDATGTTSIGNDNLIMTHCVIKREIWIRKLVWIV